MTFRPELLDELLKGYQSPEDLVGTGGILKQLTTALVERCLNAEMAHHLEEERAEPVEATTPRNRRNGHSKKTIKGEFGEAEIAIPRDRNGAFEPVILQKGQTRFEGFLLHSPLRRETLLQGCALIARFCRSIREA